MANAPASLFAILPKIWLLTFIGLYQTSWIWGELDANLTLQNVWGRLPQPGLRSMIQCMGSDHAPAGIKFSRKLDTGQGPRLPKFSQQFLQGKPVFARIFLMPSEDGMNRFGAFQCKTARQGVATEVVTLKLPPLDLAELDAAAPYRVADAGDSVDLEVRAIRQLALPVRWRHNGRAVPAWDGRLRVELRGVTRAADAGIYECYHDGRRGHGLHALIRLVVRSCPRDLYGAGCALACPPCRNGGVCHDEWGMCVCPAGFTGATCDLACGGNHFGADCSKLCTPPQSNSSNMDEGCAFHLFCKPDPYGCSCAPGFKGPQCMDHCEPGWYGADCRQSCRCARGVSACNRITGHCDGGCAKDWRGASCQIHDPGSGDFVETTTMALCPPRSYGPRCEKRCRCASDEPCDVVTGRCPAGCREGWGGASCGACAPGRFGGSCEAHCHCEGGHHSCDRDGYCYSGCEAGWAGFTCQQECTAGRFGPNCASTCRCRDGPAACHRVSGACAGDCESGYTGADCQTLCPPDAYGVNCAQSCACSNGGQCSRVDGTCACSDRWRGTSCNESEPQIVAATDEEATAGQQLFLSCTADAVPAPDMNLSSSDFPGLTFNVRTLEQHQYQAVMRVKPANAGEFSFKCTAKNPHGFDMKMITLSVIEPPRLLQRPQLLGQASDALKVGWREWAFSQDAGGKISDKVEYLVVFRQAGASGWERAGDWRTGPDSSVEGLQPDTRYEVAVRCRSRGKGAEGAAGPALVATTLCGAPTADGIPQNFLPEKITQTEVDLAWKSPPDMSLQCQLAGYSLSYQLEFDDSSRQTVEIASGSNSGVQLQQLSPNSAYVLHLHPVTAVGRSEYFAELIINTTEALPGPVTQVDVQAVEEPDLLLVTWKEPDAGAVSGYVVTYDLVDRGQCGAAGDAPGKRHVHSADTEVTLQNLHPYSTYNVSIRARNSAGEGEPATAVAVTAEAGPDAGPPNVRVAAASSSSLRFRWDAIPCEARNGDVVKYEYALLESAAALAGRGRRFADIGFGGALVAVEGLEAAVPDLSPDAEYGFAVRGRTRAEPGPFSDLLFHRTREDLPAPPGALAVSSASATHLALSWSRPDPANGRVVGYRIQLWNHLGADVAADLTRNATDAERLSDAVGDLRPATDYFVKIKAATSVGWGEWSHPISGRTLDDVPDVPSEISVLQSGKETLNISWTAPVTPNGVLGDYKVTYRPVSSADPTFDAAAEDLALNVNNRTTEFFLKELHPGTQYNVSVQAQTSAGYGPAAWLMAWTGTSGDHLPPTVRTLDFDSTNETIPIVFSTSGSSSVYKYQVIVEDARHRGPIDEALLDGHQRAVAQRQLPYYIAAEWDASALAGGDEHSFVVGDRKQYGGFTNVHLNPGHEYKIRIRTLFLKDDKVKSILSEPKGHTSATSVFKVDHKNDTKVLGLDLIVFVLVLISTLVLIVIIAFISGVIICTKRQKKKSTNSFSTRDSALSESLTWSVLYKVPAEGMPPPLADSSTLVTFLDRTSTFKRRQNTSDASRGIRNEDLFDFMNNSSTGLQLTQEYKRLVSGQTSHWTAARRNENMKKNRYSNILPYDRNRVILHPEFSRSDYINASYIDGYRRPREYIVTQGPMQATINDFWKMVWQENCPVIVMVTNLVENGKEKCVKYWPDETMICGNMEILLIHLEDNADFAVRTLLIRKVDEGSTQRVQQYQFTDWTDGTIPSNPNSLLKMIKRVRGDHPVLGGPMIVHCSGGAGRSGACLALDALCQQAEEEKVVDVFRFVDEASRQRVQFLQTLDQYAFVYEALLEAVQHEDTAVPLEEIGAHLRHLGRSATLDPAALVVRQFNKLNRTRKKIDVSCCSAALSDCNIFKNRDPLTVPVDSERIKLIVEDEDEEGSDYINAVLVHGYGRRRSYLATQMPMQHTVEHFWRMVRQHESSLILMLNACDETDDLNVGIYWPDQGECSYGDIDVQLVTYESQEDFVIRIMKVSDRHQAPGLFQKVIQLHYKGDLTDAKPASVIRLLRAVDAWHLRTCGGPITVHCWDGATECGLFLAADAICNQMKSEAVLDVFQVVKGIRFKRPEFVRNIDQYRMCFEVAQELAEIEETSHARRKVSIKI